MFYSSSIVLYERCKSSSVWSWEEVLCPSVYVPGRTIKRQGDVSQFKQGEIHFVFDTLLKKLRHNLCSIKISPVFLKFIILNPCWPSLFLTIFVLFYFFPPLQSFSSLANYSYYIEFFFQLTKIFKDPWKLLKYRSTALRAKISTNF